MAAASLAAPRPEIDSPSPVPAVKSRALAPPKIQKNLLIQFLVCVSPLIPAFYGHRPNWGGFAFSGSLIGMMLFHAWHKRPIHVLCLFVSAIPLVDLLRGTYMPFNTPVLILGATFAWIWVSPGGVKEFWKRRDMPYVIAASAIYWLASFFLTGDYSRNLRSLEWSLCASAIFILSERRSFLSTAMIGVGVSAIIMGLILLPYGDRLGMGFVPGMDYTIGNPIVLGVPCAFILLLTIAEHGRWLLLENRPFCGSWLILIVGMIIIGIWDPKARLPMLASAVGFAFLIAIIFSLNIPRVESVQHYFLQTISPDTSLQKRTTGRSEQWEAIPAILEASPIWGVGPGGGRAASVFYANKNIIFHSLYLQVTAEMGIAGLMLLLVLLASILRRGVAHARTYGEVVPLLGAASFMMMGLSVEALDIVGGMMLGIAFVGGNPANLWRVRNQFAVSVSRSAAGREPALELI
jgi:hypothetical protein